MRYTGGGSAPQLATLEGEVDDLTTGAVEGVPLTGGVTLTGPLTIDDPAVGETRLGGSTASTPSVFIRRQGDAVDRVGLTLFTGGDPVITLSDGTNILTAAAIGFVPSTGIVKVGSILNLDTPAPVQAPILNQIRSVSTALTFALTDLGKTVQLTGGTGRTWTVPANGTVAFPVGCRLRVRKMGTGDITLAPVDGTVTINVPTGLSLTISDQYATRELEKVATNEWVLSQ